MNLGKKLVFLAIFAGITAGISAQSARVIPLDMFLIIDSSAAMERSRTEILGWVDDRIIGEILQEGDRITVWSAGERSQVIYSETIRGSTDLNELSSRLNALDASSRTADFSGALNELRLRAAAVPNDRLAYSMLITASAQGLAPVLAGENRNILRWSRSDRYERWQVFVLSPDIGPRVQQAARAYMDSRR
ncbi:MAG: hypothetical protein FWG77_11655 [Treponema sp.]|nr:hypothetical protein [Treponema sp.]